MNTARSIAKNAGNEYVTSLYAGCVSELDWLEA